MSNYDIALQLTLKSLELGFIKQKSHNAGSPENELKEIAEFNSKLITIFFNSIVKSLNNPQ